MELPLQETFSWWTDFEATDAWSKANSKPFISNDTAYPIRTLQLGHNVQVRENASFCISFHIMMQTDDLTRQARDERTWSKENSNKGGRGRFTQLRENRTFASPLPSWTVPSYSER